MIDVLELMIWGRHFSLPIEYEFYKREIVTQEQMRAVKRFASHPEWIDNSKAIVEEYCKEKVLADDENTKKDNIFSYIKPECVFVIRDTTRPRVALLCKYRYDLEHGLAVVFSLDGNVTVGLQDIIL